MDRDGTIYRILSDPGYILLAKDLWRGDPVLQNMAGKAKKATRQSPYGKGIFSPHPFSNVTMGISWSSKGNEFILVVYDYASWYPEAVPLRNMSSKHIVEELVIIYNTTRDFYRSGHKFPIRSAEITICRPGNKRMHTSSYYTQANDLTEQMNLRMGQRIC